MSRPQPTQPTQPRPLEKRALLGKNRKRRLVLSLLLSLTLPLLIFAGVIEIFATNKAEFDFALVDFLPYLLLICFLGATVNFLALFFWKRKVYDGIFAFEFALVLASFLQGTFLNFGIDSLMGDGFGTGVNAGWLVGNTLIWLGLLAGCMVAVFAISRRVRDTVYGVVVILLVIMLGTQGVNLAVTALTTDLTAPPVGTADNPYVLTEKDLYQISTKDNVVVFVIDRFDRNYVEYVFETYPETFADLDGFTYYEDNLSLHMRTWPASPSLVTGLDIDFITEDAEAYTKRAYGTSPFLQAMKDNDYRVKIYVDNYYCYRDASVFAGVADNACQANASYTVKDPLTLTGRLIQMAGYRLAPIATKSAFNLSSSSFTGFVTYHALDDRYTPNDAILYQKLQDEGFSTQSKDNNFTYLHLSGCHPPYYIDENGNPRQETWADNNENASRAMRGDFLIIKAYIQALKEAGAYEDATIIITGDHPSPCGVDPEIYGDNRLPTEPRLTALFVKRAGEQGTPLQKSDAPVAQCNFIPSVIASANIKTDIDFGEPYWSENLADVRVYHHIINRPNKNYDVVSYEVKGDGRDFANWHKGDAVAIGDLYE